MNPSENDSAPMIETKPLISIHNTFISYNYMLAITFE